MATKINPPRTPKAPGTNAGAPSSKARIAAPQGAASSSPASTRKSASTRASAAREPNEAASAPGGRRATIRTDVKPLDRTKGEGRILTEDEIRKAAAEGRKIVAYSPTELDEFLQGHRTLGELEGISKEEQYRMAEMGYRFLTEGKLAQGRDVFFGLVALDPFDAYFLTCLGSAHQQEKKNEEAERLYTRALEVNPYQTTARTHRGELRAMTGRLQEAIDDLARAVQDDPDGKDPAVKRAAVLLKAIQAKLN